MVKIHARKEKRYSDHSSKQGKESYVWDVWLDITIQTTHIRNWTKTELLVSDLPTEESANEIVREIKQDRFAFIAQSMKG